MATAVESARSGDMDSKESLRAEDRSWFADDRFVRPCSARDGVGSALRAIYSEAKRAPDLPEDFSRLLRMIG